MTDAQPRRRRGAAPVRAERRHRRHRLRAARPRARDGRAERRPARARRGGAAALPGALEVAAAGRAHGRRPAQPRLRRPARRRRRRRRGAARARLRPADRGRPADLAAGASAPRRSRRQFDRRGPLPRAGSAASRRAPDRRCGSLTAMQVETPRLARARGSSSPRGRSASSPWRSAVSLYLIVVTGAVVRLTALGARLRELAGLQAGALLPGAGPPRLDRVREPRRRPLPDRRSRSAAWLAARRRAGSPRWVTLARARDLPRDDRRRRRSGCVTVLFDLHPLLVATHFLLALVVLAGGDRRRARGLGQRARARRVAAAVGSGWVGLALAGACVVLVVTGTLSTAAGPHSGGEDSRPAREPARRGLRPRARDGGRSASSFLVVLVCARTAAGAEARGLFRAALGLLALLLVQMAVGEIQWRNAAAVVARARPRRARGRGAGTVALVALLWRPARLSAERAP